MFIALSVTLVPQGKEAVMEPHIITMAMAIFGSLHRSQMANYTHPLMKYDDQQLINFQFLWLGAL